MPNKRAIEVDKTFRQNYEIATRNIRSRRSIFSSIYQPFVTIASSIFKRFVPRTSYILKPFVTMMSYIFKEFQAAFQTFVDFILKFMLKPVSMA